MSASPSASEIPLDWSAISIRTTSTSTGVSAEPQSSGPLVKMPRDFRNLRNWVCSGALHPKDCVSSPKSILILSGIRIHLIPCRQLATLLAFFKPLFGVRRYSTAAFPLRFHRLCAGAFALPLGLAFALLRRFLHQNLGDAKRPRFCAADSCDRMPHKR